MSHSLPRSFIRQLVLIGKSKNFLKIESLFERYPSQKEGDFMRKGTNFWKPLTDSLSDDDLCCLVRSLAIIERDYKSIGGGSASAAIWTFALLWERNRCPDLANWILNEASSYHVDNYMKNFSK